MTATATALRFALVAIIAASTFTPSAFAAQRKPQTQAEVDCWNRATNDYFDQVKECEKALSDIPQQLDQCKSDAKQDMDRARNQCVKAARTGKSGIYGGSVKPPAEIAP